MFHCFLSCQNLWELSLYTDDQQRPIMQLLGYSTCPENNPPEDQKALRATKIPDDRPSKTPSNYDWACPEKLCNLGIHAHVTHLFWNPCQQCLKGIARVIEFDLLCTWVLLHGILMSFLSQIFSVTQKRNKEGNSVQNDSSRNILCIMQC